MAVEDIHEGALGDLFRELRSGRLKRLRPWQSEVLAAYSALESGDVAIEAPTGSGKTLVALLIAEEARRRTGASVAYLAGNKQLARQVERHADELGVPIVRFQGAKHDWNPHDVRAYEWGEAVAVTNYWAYFNIKPGLAPGDVLILDDVHLVEGTLRGFFTTEIPLADPLATEVLERIQQRFPYYGLVEDLLEGGRPPAPPEMLAFVDSAELAPDLRKLIDDELEEDTDAWWGWQRIRRRAEVCCWIVSRRGVTITPYIVPTQDHDHFASPERRIYLSATVGTVDDVQRRLGCPKFTKLAAGSGTRQGERFVVVRQETEKLDAQELVEEVADLLEGTDKALWLCARSTTASEFMDAIEAMGSEGDVLRLHQDNGADEAFAKAASGHLVAAGRYDGMDFPHDACRIEIMPEAPVALSDLEEFVSAYLRDATFADARFAQRVAQALGRCNRAPDDRAVYVLADPEFRGRLTRKSVLTSLPLDVQEDIARGMRLNLPFAQALGEARRFLAGSEFPGGRPPKAFAKSVPETGSLEVDAVLSLWNEDYAGAAATINDLVAELPDSSREYRAFWMSLRALALSLQERKYGDTAAGVDAREALRAAVRVGGHNTFFARQRAALARAGGTEAPEFDTKYDRLFEAWDALIEGAGSDSRLAKYAESLENDLGSTRHDTVARALARFGKDVLGLETEAPKATSGEPDVVWWFTRPTRALVYEIKLAPKTHRVTNEAVEQAEGAVRFVKTKNPTADACGLIVTPHAEIDDTAEARLDRTSLVHLDSLVEEVGRILLILREYQKGWTRKSEHRTARRAAVERDLPRRLDWFWAAADKADPWLTFER